MIGQRIAHYEIIRELGSGGMGVVYEARDLKLQRHVAIKAVRAAASEVSGGPPAVFAVRG